jgi:hypothetical protein
LLAVEANGDMPTMRLVLKRMSREWDWVMAASEDHRCRSVMLWQHGLLDRLQPNIDHAILACARDGEGWVILMRDVSAHILTSEPLSAAQVECLLDALSALHATFWQAPELANPALGLGDTSSLIGAFLPATAKRIPSTTTIVPQMIIDGWALLQEMVAPEVADILGQLFADRQPLCAALNRYPSTLVHGDYRATNFGIACQPEPHVVLLDWQLAAYGAATIDLAWFLCMPNLQLSSVSAASASEYYRQRLAERLGVRFDESWWQPMLSLGMLANVLRNGCFKAWFIVNVFHDDEVMQAAERRMIEVYSEQVRTALQWL